MQSASKNFLLLDARVLLGSSKSNYIATIFFNYISLIEIIFWKLPTTYRLAVRINQDEIVIGWMTGNWAIIRLGIAINCSKIYDNNFWTRAVCVTELRNFVMYECINVYVVKQLIQINIWAAWMNWMKLIHLVMNICPFGNILPEDESWRWRWIYMLRYRTECRLSQNIFAKEVAITVQFWLWLRNRHIWLNI